MCLVFRPCVTKSWEAALQTKTRFHAYRGGLIQHSHRHQHAGLSMVLSGAFLEDSCGRERHVHAGMFALRASDFEHRVRYGEHGALIVSTYVPPDEFASLAKLYSGEWKAAPPTLVRHLLPEAANNDCSSSATDVMWDVLASVAPPEPAGDRAPWLLSARDELVDEEASITAIAERAGVHRVYFSRVFASAFGMPPSIYRRRMRTLRAVAAAMQGGRAAEAAYTCGFADQSHMARAVKETTGSSFKKLQALRSKVTFVQD